MEAIPAYSVAQFNAAARALLEDSPLRAVSVTGEIDGFKRYPSGHCYFSLRDDAAALPAVLFAQQAARLTFQPRDGMCVTALGAAGLYEKTGKFQLICRALAPAGEGLLAARRAALLEKLRAEGLTDPARKRTLPACPRRVAVLTSPQGAVLRDILRTAHRRNPTVTILLIPVPVQGPDAAAAIAGKLSLIPALAPDVVIVARGGGSAEDLSPFDDEALARAVAACPVPVVSAIGHETDFSVCDAVADLRAGTPSIAAERVFPPLADWLAALTHAAGELRRALTARCDAAGQRLDTAWSALQTLNPQHQWALSNQRLDALTHALHGAFQARRDAAGHALALGAAALEAQSPLAPLTRGYALASQGGVPVRRAAALQPGPAILRFADGTRGVVVNGS